MPRFRSFTPIAIGLLMALASGAVRAAEGSAGVAVNLPTPIPPVAAAARARQLLNAGQTDLAERMVRAALAAGADDSLLCLSGEIQFRRARFPEAARDYEAAIALNPDNARAWWGLGRIEQANFREQRARDLFSRAFVLNHRDIDIILAYADFVTDPASRSTLLDNVARLARVDQPERAERAVAQRLIQERLQGRTPGRLASPYAAYRLPLSGFRPNSSAQDGILVAVRINGGKPLRLLVDTGARGMVIHARAARNLGLETIVASRLTGLGDPGAAESRVALARRVEFGDLAFEECLVEVSERSLTAGADGVLGIDVFGRFKIGVDAREGVLQLTPFDDPAAAPPDALQASVAAVGMRNLLLLKARVEGGKEGLFLVDTGAAFTAVSREYLPPALPLGRPVELKGAQGPVDGAFRVAPLAFRVGGLALVEHTPLAVDLRSISQLEGIEIAGILGYSMLGKAPFTIDLRTGTVEFARAAR
jgi:tetratricopeptide (TPR) repeat protein